MCFVSSKRSTIAVCGVCKEHYRAEWIDAHTSGAHTPPPLLQTPPPLAISPPPTRETVISMFF